ncbi:MAG TPA: CpXC domain-containing protein [Aggregatilineaceae bacterium]|nr:CpXC domain-containing protein [Aggregatilineaceae bacterium]
MRTTLNCSRCGQTFPAIIEQIVDAGLDPQAKARFLSGRVNMVTCPNCGHTLAVGTPLMYHDPDKELLLVHVPMELNIAPQERERVIGDLTKRVMDSTPNEKRKGYLFQPKPVLTIPGMIDIILEADGITAEMRDAQREKMRVMEMFLQVRPDQWPQMLEEQGSVVDSEFFQMILLTAENAAQTGKEQMAQGLMYLYNFLIQNSEVGQQVMQAAEARDAAVHEMAEELQSYGDDLTRDEFFAIVLKYADDPDRIQALVGLMRPAFDYAFFQELSERIDQASGDEKAQLENLREQVLTLTSVVDQQTQAVLQRATDTLKVIMSAEDLDAAIRPRLEMVDDAFLAVLQANIQAAEQHNDERTAERLREVLAKTLSIMRESAPPEIRFIQDLMSAEDDATANELIETQASKFNGELLEIMEAIALDLEENGQDDNAERLRAMRDYAQGFVSASE